ncbi:MAG: 3-phenylpropionate MFS transporter [Solibacillus sp.]
MNHQRWLSKNFITFFFTWGVFLPYWTGWLVSHKGLTIAQASLVMSLGLVVRAGSTMFLFPSLSKHWSNKVVLVFFTAFSLAVALLYVPANSFSSLLMITLLFHIAYPALLPAVESSATVLMQQGGIEYGKARSFGSIAFIVSVLIISMFTGVFGEQAILWSMILGLVGMLVIQLMPAPEMLSEKPKVIKKAVSMKQLFSRGSFVVVLIVVILLQGAHAAYYNYGYIYLQHLNVNPFYIGMVLNVAVLFEVLYFLKADTFLAKWRPSSLLLLAAIGASVRWGLIFIFPSIWIFILSQALHALSFGVAHYAFIRFISKELPQEQMANAQGLYSAFAMSLSAAVLTLFGGMLYEIEPGLAFLGMTVCTIPAIVLLLATRNRFHY